MKGSISLEGAGCCFCYCHMIMRQGAAALHVTTQCFATSSSCQHMDLCTSLSWILLLSTRIATGEQRRSFGEVWRRKRWLAQEGAAVLMLYPWNFALPPCGKGGAFPLNTCAAASLLLARHLLYAQNVQSTCRLINIWSSHHLINIILQHNPSHVYSEVNPQIGKTSSKCTFHMASKIKNSFFNDILKIINRK